MNINECMSREPRGVRVTDGLDVAAKVLWEQDCGFVPVLDAVGALVGVVTDRDLCMASYTRGRALFEIPVSAVMSQQIRCVRADDRVDAALAAMQELQVHRLPVLDARGALVGVLSTNDLIRAAATQPNAAFAGQVMQTLAAIGRSRSAESSAGSSSAVIAPKASKSPVEKVTIVAHNTKVVKSASGKAAKTTKSKAKVATDAGASKARAPRSKAKKG